MSDFPPSSSHLIGRFRPGHLDEAPACRNKGVSMSDVSERRNPVIDPSSARKDESQVQRAVSRRARLGVILAFALGLPASAGEQLSLTPTAVSTIEADDPGGGSRILLQLPALDAIEGGDIAGAWLIFDPGEMSSVVTFEVRGILEFLRFRRR